MILVVILFVLFGCGPADAQTSNPPGGFVEPAGTAPRAKFSAAQISTTVPTTRSQFTFPAPYNTTGYRLTIPADCSSNQDCVNYIGYSYWPMMNNHVNDSYMYIVIGLSALRGGNGLTLFRLQKDNGVITKIGNLFPTGTTEQTFTGEQYYFSLSQPYTFYFNTDFRLRTFNVDTQTFGVVVNILNRNYTDSGGNAISLGCTTANGCPRRLHQTHVNADDTVFAGTLVNTNTQALLGCWVYRVPQDQFRFYPASGTFDECLIDKSGRYAILLENLGTPGDSLGNRIFDNTTGTLIATKTGPSGTLGHMDCGYEFCFGIDNNGPTPPNPNSTTKYTLASPTVMTLLHFNADWSINILNHPSYTNALPIATRGLNRQYFCGSGFNSLGSAEEIMCVRPDGAAPLQQLVVAPIMTTRGSTLGGFWNNGDYGQQPKGHLDVTGRYFLWTANLGSTRLDAFLVEVPSQQLVDLQAPAPPSGVFVQ